MIAMCVGLTNSLLGVVLRAVVCVGLTNSVLGLNLRAVVCVGLTNSMLGVNQRVVVCVGLTNSVLEVNLRAGVCVGLTKFQKIKSLHPRRDGRCGGLIPFEHHSLAIHAAGCGPTLAGL
jgi:hypothetical protein